MVKPDQKPENSTRIMVLDLEKSVSQRELSEAFQSFGTIYSVKIDTYSDLSSRGVGYIQFDSD